jgi:hypothetical protein
VLAAGFVADAAALPVAAVAAGAVVAAAAAVVGAAPVVAAGFVAAGVAVGLLPPQAASKVGMMRESSANEVIRRQDLPLDFGPVPMVSS